MITQNYRIIGIVLSVGLLLLIPFIAMQFSDEVHWTLVDFVTAGILLLGTGLLLDFAIRKITNVSYRIIIVLAILAALLLIWAELAVGLFGTPFAGT